MPKDLLLEIGTEPLPARFVPDAISQLEQALSRRLREERLFFRGEPRSYATPRRLAVLLLGVDDESTERRTEVSGPPARLWKEADGRFTAQAVGFARKNGVAPEDLKVVATAKGDVLAATLTVESEPAAEVLSRVIPEIASGLQFPKAMEWEATRFRFGRPIRNLIVVLGRSIVPVRLAGIKSSRTLRGLPGAKPAALTEPKAYASKLRDLLVIADPSERRQVLLKRLEQEGRRLGAKVDLDEGLVNETVHMTEHPVPIVGSFREGFLELPAPLLALVLKKQLKFFPVHEPSGKLMSRFIGVRDGVSEGQELVREGYQRVLTARCDDAVFFFERDRAVKLADRLAELERVTYQKALGSMGDKSRRVAALSSRLCEKAGDDGARADVVERVAQLCYADLVTDVVREFPELQGVMGGVYARLEGADERVALGLEQFYQPVGPKSPVPLTVEGALVSLAGKLDSLAGCFLAGLAPTASADPFALRRQALGAIRILLERQLPLDLESAAAEALALYPQAGFDAEKARRELSDFLWGRAQSFFEEQGFRVDEIRAVRRGGLANLKKTYLRLRALRAVRSQADFEPLAAAYKRASNILKQAGAPPTGANGLERSRLQQDAERALYDAVAELEVRLAEQLGQDGYEEGLRGLVTLKPQLDRFFEQVMVMSEDLQVRVQRLALLGRVVSLFAAIADLSELQGPAA